MKLWQGLKIVLNNDKYIISKANTYNLYQLVSKLFDCNVSLKNKRD